jgi:hypothetical protein
VIKYVAMAVGLGLLLATAHLTITKTTGYTDAHAVLVLAIAAGVGIGAWTLGAAWGERRKSLAVLTAVAMISGELFGLAQTGDRIAAERERSQAPARAQMAAHQQAADRLATAMAALEALPATSPRLTEALERKAAADSAVLEKSDKRGCASNCRKLLEQQVSTAQSEIVAARSEIIAKRAAAEREVAAARAALEVAPLPKLSGTPLADRLGIDPAKLDMIVAALGAVGANGLAVCLIAFGAHGRHRVEIVKPEARVHDKPTLANHGIGQGRAGRAPLTAPQRDPRQHAAEFSVRCLKPAPSEALPLSHMDARYRTWCAENGHPRLAPTDLAREMWELFGECGIAVENVNGELVARGVALA